MPYLRGHVGGVEYANISTLKFLLEKKKPLKTTTKFPELQNQNEYTLVLGIFENLEPFLGKLVGLRI